MEKDNVLNIRSCYSPTYYVCLFSILTVPLFPLRCGDQVISSQGDESHFADNLENRL